MAIGNVDLLIQAKDKASAKVLKLDKNLNRLGKTASKIDGSKFASGFNRIKSGPSSGIGRFVTQTIQGFTAVAAAGLKMATKIATLPLKMVGGLAKLIPGVGGIVGGMIGVFAGGFQTIIGGAVSMAHGILDAAAGIVGSVVNAGVSMATGIVKAFASAVSKITGMLGSIAGKVGGALGKVGKVAGVAGAGLATLYGWQMKKGMWDLADIQGYTAALAIVFKSTKKATEAVQWAIKFSERTPFTPKPVIEAAKQLAVYGMEYKEWIGRAGELAAVFKTPIEEIIGHLGRLKAGMRGRSLMMLGTKGVTQERLKAEGIQYDKGGRALGETKDIMAAIKRIIDRDFGGALELMSKKFHGVLSTLIGMWELFRMKLAKPMFDVFEKGMVRARDAWTAFQETANYKAMLSGLQGVAHVIGTGIVNALTAVAQKAGEIDWMDVAKKGREAWQWIGEKISWVWEKLNEINWTKVGKAGEQAWQWIGEKISWAGGKLGELSDLIGRTDFSALKDNLQQAAIDAAEKALEAWGVFADEAGKRLAGVADGFLQKIQTTLGAIKPIVVGMEDRARTAKLNLTDPKLAMAAWLGKKVTGHEVLKPKAGPMEKAITRATDFIGENRGGLKRVEDKGIGAKAAASEAKKRFDALRPEEWTWEGMKPMKRGERRDAVAPKEDAAAKAWRDSLAETVKNAKAAAAAMAKKAAEPDAMTQALLARAKDRDTSPQDMGNAIARKQAEDTAKKQEEAAKKLADAGKKLDSAGDKIGRGPGGGGGGGSPGAAAAKGYQLPESKGAAKYERSVQKQLGRMGKGHFNAPGFGGKPTAAWREARKRFRGAVQQKREDTATSKIEDIRGGKREAGKWSPKKRQREIDQWGKSAFGKKGWAEKQKDLGITQDVSGQDIADSAGPGGGGKKGQQGQAGPLGQMAQAAQGAQTAAQAANQAMNAKGGEITSALQGMRDELEGLKEAINNINTSES